MVPGAMEEPIAYAFLRSSAAHSLGVACRSEPRIASMLDVAGPKASTPTCWDSDLAVQNWPKPYTSYATPATVTFRVLGAELLSIAHPSIVAFKTLTWM